MQGTMNITFEQKEITAKLELKAGTNLIKSTWNETRQPCKVWRQPAH